MQEKIGWMQMYFSLDLQSEASRYMQLFTFPPGNMVIQAENIAFLDISGQK